jgi:hypothetical protein
MLQEYEKLKNILSMSMNFGVLMTRAELKLNMWKDPKRQVTSVFSSLRIEFGT